MANGSPAPAIRLKRLLQGYWFLPLSLGVLGVVLALVLLEIEDSYEMGKLVEGYPWLRIAPESSRAVLGTIAAAMISAASIVYSLSLLIRTIATGTLGPRLIESYDKAHINRITLGVQLSVFLYCLTVLYGIGTFTERRTLTVMVAVLLAVAALVCLVVVVHSVARQVHVDATVARVAGALRERLRTAAASATHETAQPPLRRGAALVSVETGYVETIDRGALLAQACALDAVLVVVVRPGDFVVAGKPVLRILAEREPDGTARDALLVAVTIGPQRTDDNDLRFNFRLLVEIALRALSPGVNDVFTAIACTDHLAGLLAELDGRSLTPEAMRDGDGRARVFSRELTFEDIADGVFHPLRQSGAKLTVMAIAMLERLRDLIEVVGDPVARANLLHHAELIAVEATNAASTEHDRDTIADIINVIRAHGPVQPSPAAHTPGASS